MGQKLAPGVTAELNFVKVWKIIAATLFWYTQPILILKNSVEIIIEIDHSEEFKQKMSRFT